MTFRRKSALPLLFPHFSPLSLLCLLSSVCLAKLFLLLGSIHIEPSDAAIWFKVADHRGSRAFCFRNALSVCHSVSFKSEFNHHCFYFRHTGLLNPSHVGMYVIIWKAQVKRSPHCGCCYGLHPLWVSQRPVVLKRCSLFSWYSLWVCVCVCVHAYGGLQNMCSMYIAAWCKIKAAFPVSIHGGICDIVFT